MLPLALNVGRVPSHVSSAPGLHIPDGFLSLPVSLAFWALTVIVMSIAVRRAGRQLGDRQVALVGILAAAVFAGQMLNFPVAGGTSGHLLGGALVAIVLGPWAAVLAMSAVIGVQGLLFQDGGLLTMGANIFNMGIMTALVGYGIYRQMAGSGDGVRYAAAALAAWCSVMVGAFVCTAQLAASGMVQPTLAFPTMLGVHALIGVGEALLTVGALRFITATRPELVAPSAVQSRGGWGWVVGGVLTALAVTLLSPLASSDPDGLSRVAADFGFAARQQGAPFHVLPGYTVPFLGDTAASTIVAGMVGVVVLFALLTLVASRLRREHHDA